MRLSYASGDSTKLLCTISFYGTLNIKEKSKIILPESLEDFQQVH